MNWKICRKCREKYYGNRPEVTAWGENDMELWEKDGQIYCPYMFEHENELTKKMMFVFRVGKKEKGYTIDNAHPPDNCRYKMEQTVLNQQTKEYGNKK